ncbi:hypothetical protein [Caenibius sp. WL]|uniref:DUF6896 domain-containing protein n=1 Tax=Caenibius sp. WL TaxID=2872646 RepID=UPI001C990D3A|nr:hypothetical protein [Caenibius sp. WL]QZP08484.1 hypothetical protein K5X80_01275 [Caenibius sp. WL]
MLNLITDYLTAVEECLDLFDQKFGRRDLIRAWREGAIPQQGELPGGVEYQMHGVGCAVEYADHDVDFDFANQHEVGFDAWRLWLYAEQYPERYPAYQARDAVEAALAECLSNGAIRRVESRYPGESNDRLFELSKAA